MIVGLPVVACLGAFGLALAPFAAFLFTLYGTFMHSYNSSSSNRSGSENGVMFWGIRNLYTQFNGSTDNRRMRLAEAMSRANNNTYHDDRFETSWYSSRCCHGNPVVSGFFALIIGLILMPIAFVVATVVLLLAVLGLSIITLL